MFEKRSESGEKGVFAFQQGREKASRTALLNHLAALYGYKTYLEIGVRRRAGNFDNVNIAQKWGVDPDPNAEADFIETSDAFFANHKDMKFDLIFIDGLHTGEQVEPDIINALAALNPGGAVMLHDLNPPTAQHARTVYEVNGEYPAWNGTCWEAFARLRATRPDLEMYVIDTDWGCGFVRPGQQQTITVPHATYEDLARNRKEILNLISVREFLQRHPPTAARA